MRQALDQQKKCHDKRKHLIEVAGQIADATAKTNFSHIADRCRIYGFPALQQALVQSSVQKQQAASTQVQNMWSGHQQDMAFMQQNMGLGGNMNAQFGRMVGLVGIQSSVSQSQEVCKLALQQEADLVLMQFQAAMAVIRGFVNSGSEGAEMVRNVINSEADSHQQQAMYSSLHSHNTGNHTVRANHVSIVTKSLREMTNIRLF